MVAVASASETAAYSPAMPAPPSPKVVISTEVFPSVRSSIASPVPVPK